MRIFVELVLDYYSRFAFRTCCKRAGRFEVVVIGIIPVNGNGQINSLGHFVILTLCTLFGHFGRPWAFSVNRFSFPSAFRSPFFLRPFNTNGEGSELALISLRGLSQLGVISATIQCILKILQNNYTLWFEILHQRMS